MQELLKKYSQVYVAGAMGAEAPKVFNQRRTGHLRKLDRILVISGVDREPGGENIWMMNALRIFQEPSLLWLSGINQTGVKIILNPFLKGKNRYAVFLPKKNSEREFWDGVRFGVLENSDSNYQQNLKEMKQLLGTSRIYAIDDFQKVLLQDLTETKQKNVYSFYHEYILEDGKTKSVKTDHNWAFKTQVQGFLRKNFGREALVNSWAAEHYALRLPQDEFQIADANKAQEITRAGFERFLPQVQKIRNENEIAATLEFEMKKNSPYGLAFPSIVAGGQNACTLHYLKNDEELPAEGLLLLDFGIRWGTQHADISRTIPVNGKYNPLQKLLYDIVLSAQKYNEDYIRAGVLLKDANERVWDFIENELEEKFFAKGGVAKRSYEKKPHGVSHLMGEQEHDGDPFRIYSTTPLKPGMMISNEPGLYGHFCLEINGVEYSEWIGIRLEDDLIVTKNGCENLSKDFPHTTEEIEHWMNQEVNHG